MAFSDDPTDPASMTAEQRIEELSSILAAGVLRLRARAALPAPAPTDISPDSSQKCLDESPRKRLHGHRG